MYTIDKEIHTPENIFQESSSLEMIPSSLYTIEMIQYWQNNTSFQEIFRTGSIYP